MITSASELMAIAGFDRESYQRLAPYVTVLPRWHEAQRQHGVGRAAGVAVGQHRHRDGRSRLVEERAGAEFIDIDATFSRASSSPMYWQEIDGVSEHFLLTATVTLGSNQLTMRSVLQRDRSGITRALFRSLGVE